MTLTDEIKINAYEMLTFEDLNKTAQDAQWENRNSQSINVSGIRTAVPAGMEPADASDPNGDYVMLVRKSSGAIGATKLLKVMAGDRIHASLDYYYPGPAADNSNTNTLQNILTSIASSIDASSAVASIIQGKGSTIFSQLNSNSDFSNFVDAPAQTDPLNPSNQAPKAYLCVLFFNEQMKFNAANSRVIPVAYAPGEKRSFDLKFSNALQAEKNGYVYVYFTNESDELVYFDNFSLSHDRGRITEETHYYPFGLMMAGITSKSIGKMPIKQSFNGGNELQNNEFSSGAGLELYHANFRMLDPQIGRFHQVDPLDDFSVIFSPYNFASNNPISRLDPWGLKDTVINGETMKRDPDLASVTVTYRKKAKSFGGFYWPSYTRSETRAWRNERYLYNSRRQSGESIVQKGDSHLYLDNLHSFKRRFEAEEDGRKMQLGAVVIMAAPIAGPAIGKTLATTYGRSFIRNAAINLLQNGGDYKKMDLFDITANTLNPFSGLGGTLGSAGLNSLIDFYPMSENGPQLNFLGDGKSIGQTGVDFSYGLFAGATGTVLGSSSTAATFMNIVLGNFSTIAQESIGADK